MKRDARAYLTHSKNKPFVQRYVYLKKKMIITYKFPSPAPVVCAVGRASQKGWVLVAFTSYFQVPVVGISYSLHLCCASDSLESLQILIPYKD